MVIVSGEISPEVTTILSAAGLDFVDARNVGIDRANDGAELYLATIGQARKALQDEGVTAVVVYLSAHRMLERSLKDGLTSEQALKDCRGGCEDLLAIFRQHRRQIILVSQDGLITHPEEFIQRISEAFKDHTNMSLKLDLPTDWGKVEEAAEGFPKALAQSLIYECSEIQGLSTELSAGSALVTDVTQRELSQTLLTLWEAQESGGQVLEKLGADNELYQLQLNQVQDELEHYFGKSRQQEQLLEQRDEKIRGLESRLADADGNVMRLEQWLKECNAHKDQIIAELSDKSALLETEQAQLKATRNAVEDLKSSMSWKITSPVRALFGILIPGRKGQ